MGTITGPVSPKEPMVTICKGKYGKLKAIKSSSIRLEGYLKNDMCSRCRTKWYAIRQRNM